MTTTLELEVVRGLARLEGEARLEVADHVSFLLDALDEFSIELLLNGNELLSGLALSSLVDEEEGIFLLLSGDIVLQIMEELVINLSGDIDTFHIDLGGSGNDIAGVDSTNGDAIQLVGSSNNTQARGEGLDTDTSSASVRSSQEDKNFTGLDGTSDGVNLLGSSVTSLVTRSTGLVGIHEEGGLVDHGSLVSLLAKSFDLLGVGEDRGQFVSALIAMELLHSPDTPLMIELRSGVGDNSLGCNSLGLSVGVGVTT